jgi:hypothetical protein
MHLFYEKKNLKFHISCVFSSLLRINITHSISFSVFTLVLPENPIILDRWGRVINRTTIGPMEEGDDVILSCRVIGGKQFS